MSALKKRFAKSFAYGMLAMLSACVFSGCATSNSKTVSPVAAVQPAVTVPPPADAAPPMSPEHFFIVSYVKMCLNAEQNDHAIAVLKAQRAPEYPTSQAILFLRHVDPDAEGHAYPIEYRGQQNNFALGLPTNAPICEMFGRRLDLKATHAAFLAFIAQLNSPHYKLRKLKDKTTRLPGGFRGHTTAYTWQAAGQSQKLVFMLTTNPSPKAEIQAFATVHYLAR